MCLKLRGWCVWGLDLCGWPCCWLLAVPGVKRMKIEHVFAEREKEREREKKRESERWRER
jgi:hypothetical protein